MDETTETTATETAETPAAEPAASAATPAPEAAPAGGLDGEAAPEKPEAAPLVDEWKGAPEGDYTNEGIQLPEGYELDETTLGGLAKVCGEMGLSQKAFSTIVTQMTPVLAQAQEAQLEQFRQQNLQAFAKDPQLGGANLKQTMATANAAYKQYTTPALRELLAGSGLNTHPDMIRLFHTLGKSLSDDAVVRGRPSGNRNPLAGFYDNSNMN